MRKAFERKQASPDATEVLLLTRKLAVFESRVEEIKMSQKNSALSQKMWDMECALEKRNSLTLVEKLRQMEEKLCRMEYRKSTTCVAHVTSAPAAAKSREAEEQDYRSRARVREELLLQKMAEMEKRISTGANKNFTGSSTSSLGSPPFLSGAEKDAQIALLKAQTELLMKVFFFSRVSRLFLFCPQHVTRFFFPILSHVTCDFLSDEM